MSDSSDELTLKKEKAILALLSSRTVEEAAGVAGVDARTLHRWLKEPAFLVSFREAKRAAFSQAIARLHQMTSAAVTTLGKVMVDPTTPASTKVRAADTILNHTKKAVELEDVEARLAELERAAEENKNRGN
jgi:hypothetical protein